MVEFIRPNAGTDSVQTAHSITAEDESQVLKKEKLNEADDADVGADLGSCLEKLVEKKE